MKEQYFGDVSDYCKYGLLRGLIHPQDVRLAVCWMLTAPDKRKDGGRVGYLESVDPWRAYDSELYDFLRAAVRDSKRNVRAIERSRILPGTGFYTGFVPSSVQRRRKWFDGFLEHSKGADLVFFDPDNGMQTPSLPWRYRRSVKHLYWDEISQVIDRGQDCLVFQHFNRERRSALIQRIASGFAKINPRLTVSAVRTAHVVLFLVSWPRRARAWAMRLRQVEEAWGGRVWFTPDPQWAPTRSMPHAPSALTP